MKRRIFPYTICPYDEPKRLYPFQTFFLVQTKSHRMNGGFRPFFGKWSSLSTGAKNRWLWGPEMERGRRTEMDVQHVWRTGILNFASLLVAGTVSHGASRYTQPRNTWWLRLLVYYSRHILKLLPLSEGIPRRVNSPTKYPTTNHWLKVPFTKMLCQPTIETTRSRRVLFLSAPQTRH